MGIERFDLDGEEAKAEQVLKGGLSGYFELVGSTFAAMAQVLGSDPASGSDALSKCLLWHLLCRMSNDLRCVEILAGRGYPLQSRSLVAGVMEVARTIVIVGGNDELAGDWYRHSNPKKAWLDDKPQERTRLFEQGLLSLGYSPAEVQKLSNAFGGLYTGFCQAKHANTEAQIFHTIDHAAGTSVDTNGPVYTEASKIQLRSALLNSATFARLALKRYVHCHVVADSRAMHLRNLETLSFVITHLATEGIRGIDELRQAGEVTDAE